MTTNTLAALQRATQRVEEQFPVETWSIDGVRVWPLVKADIHMETSHGWRRAHAPPAAPKLRDRFPVRPALEMLQSRARRRATKQHDGVNDAPLCPVDALLYSDSAFIKLDGKFYDKICDPVIDVLHAQGRSTTLVTPLSEFRHPRHTPSYFIQPALDRARVEARLRSSISTRLPLQVELPQFAPATAQFRAEVPSARIGDRAYYVRLVTYVKTFQRVYRRLLARARPKVVFIVSYHGLETMALIRECHARGIVSVDLQHGAINESHHAYASRHRFPAGGFDLLPDAFWVWSEDDAATIRRWTKDQPSAPKPYVAGNLFLETWRDERRPFVRNATERVNAIKEQTPGLHHVVYALQGTEPPALIERLKDAIRRSRGRLFWWLRMHPTQLPDERRLAGIFGGARAENHLLQAHTEIPFYGVLRQMDALATYSSTSVIEAAAFGVPSVLTSSDEQQVFQREIDAGWTTVAEPGVDLVAAIEAQIAATPALRQRMPPPAATTAAAVLDDLFARAGVR